MPKQYQKVTRTKLRKNNRYQVTVMLKKSNLDLRHHEKMLKNLENEIHLIDPIANFEIYQVKTKLIYLILMELALDGAAASLKLANKYSDKTGIKFNVRNFRKKSRKNLPSLKTEVQKSLKAGKNPEYASIAAAYKW